MRDRPNIVFLMPDQLRHDFLGCYGAGFIDTPNIDALWEEGVRYERAYSEHPVCVPARAALLTGMNAVKAGVLDNSRWLRPDYGQCGVRTWPEILNDLGYYTLSTGKMHFYPWQAPLRVPAADHRRGQAVGVRRGRLPPFPRRPGLHQARDGRRARLPREPHGPGQPDPVRVHRRSLGGRAVGRVDRGVRRGGALRHDGRLPGAPLAVRPRRRSSPPSTPARCPSRRPPSRRTWP